MLVTSWVLLGTTDATRFVEEWLACSAHGRSVAGLSPSLSLYDLAVLAPWGTGFKGRGALSTLEVADQKRGVLQGLQPRARPPSEHDRAGELAREIERAAGASAGADQGRGT